MHQCGLIANGGMKWMGRDYYLALDSVEGDAQYMDFMPRLLPVKIVPRHWQEVADVTNQLRQSPNDGWTLVKLLVTPLHLFVST